MIRYTGLILLCSLLIGCASSQKAPVIERAPATKPAAKLTEKDWRPELYAVKKGDTLYTIGLEHGYDYKEIAEANNILPPYTIYVGQKLKLKPGSPKPGSLAGKPAATAAQTPADSSAVVITPLDMGGDMSATTAGDTPVGAASVGAAIVGESTVAATGQPLLISEPKAMRQPYSEQALRVPVAPTSPATAQTAPSATTHATSAQDAANAPAVAAQTPATDITATNGQITWAWPATGKLLAGFNDGGNARGIDIGGSTGQEIKAAAPGKVIYSGSDLRGYGKLVIIKHNADYLSVYAHNSKILVKEGDLVTRGQKIAEMGNTDSDTTKLHFEIRRQGKSVDPAAYLPGNPG